jgi:3-isopropylmalate/(R)-2-methylmalate dehydratase small subunit|tara:strand:+ start:8991 stop:9530 length:540 start_codon:yes stop_codon:yes gene_type:complete
MANNFKGTVWKADGYVFAYDIIKQEFWTSALDKEENSKWVMAGVHPDFDKENGFKSEGYSFIVAGDNFAGGGKSIEHVITGLMGAGIKAVIAESFSRLQFRNAINYGMSFITCKGIKAFVSTGDELEIDSVSGKIENITTGQKIQAAPVAPFVAKVAEAGGLVSYIQNVIAEGKIGELR